MSTLAYNRLRSRRYVRARARGLSREAACRIAGYHEAGATRIERRLKAEIEQERKKLAGIFGHVPPTFSQIDARRILDAELGRLADNTFRPHAKRLEEQTLRELARQVTPGDAREHHKRIDTKLHREAKSGGGLSPRTLYQRDLCRRLIAEIEAYRSQDERRREREARLSPLEASMRPPEPLRSEALAQAPAEPPRCRVHPTQPAGTCGLCGLDPVRRWRREHEEREREIEFPLRYGSDDPWL